MGRRARLTARDIALVGVMVAVIECCKFALMHIPNVELTSFWIVIFTLFLGRRIFLAIPVFILVEGAVFGFGIWWVMYLYAWPLLALAVLLLKRAVSGAVGWAMVSGLFGLMFGALCAISYIPISGMSGAVAWWVAGIPWDILHGVANFALMLALYRPVRRVMELANEKWAK